jgi:siroheme synthase-like protein
VAFTTPLIFDLTGRPVLVVGGGRIAARKVEGLLAAGAVVTVVAPEVVADLADLGTLAGSGGVTLRRRRYCAADLDEIDLVITATGDPEVDGAVFADARTRRLPVNAADDPGHCSFTLPAVVRRGEVTVAVSTGGRSPALAVWLKEQIDGFLDSLGDVAALTSLVTAERDTVRASGQSSEAIDWGPRIAAARAHLAAAALTGQGPAG